VTAGLFLAQVSQQRVQLSRVLAIVANDDDRGLDFAAVVVLLVQFEQTRPVSQILTSWRLESETRGKQKQRKKATKIESNKETKRIRAS
jgi:hypothetical protein